MTGHILCAIDRHLLKEIKEVIRIDRFHDKVRYVYVCQRCGKRYRKPNSVELVVLHRE